MVEKSKRITIEISTETYEQICGVKTYLEQIFNVSVSLDKTLKVMLTPKLVDYGEMIQGKLVDTAPRVIEEKKIAETETDDL